MQLLSNSDLDQMGLMSRTTRWRLVKRGEFPAGIAIGHCVRWRLEDVQVWLDRQPRRGAGPDKDDVTSRASPTVSPSVPPGLCSFKP